MVVVSWLGDDGVEGLEESLVWSVVGGQKTVVLRGEPLICRDVRRGFGLGG